MDTRYWGPSGWRLLHMIAHSNRAASNRTFWETLPYVLPCKFCRTSLTTYYEQHPIPKKQEEFPEWLYKIHNLVNQKLRDQGQHLDPNPSFEAVKQRYEQLLQQGCAKTCFPGWDFVFSIADNHPDSSPSKPMPDTPEHPPTSLKERNKYNLLTPKERKTQLKKFWSSLPDVLPFEEWRELWNKNAGSVTKATKNRRAALSWLWRIRCGITQGLAQISKDTFQGLCKQIASHRSGCSKSMRAKTCRRMPQPHSGGGKKTRKKTRSN